MASVIPDGPGEKAKIKPGDVILTFNGKKVSEMRRLPRIVADTEVGKTVPLEIWRDKKKITLNAKIEELEDSSTEVAARTKGSKKSGQQQTVEALGLRLSSVTPRLKKKFSLEKDAKGVVVTKVDENGPAAEKGIRPGDLIVEISQSEVTSPGDIADKVAEAKKAGRKSVLLLLEGRGGLRFVAIRIGKS